MSKLFDPMMNGSGAVMRHVAACARAVKQPSMGDEAFLRFCISRLSPPPRGRDTRKQRLVRAMRRMEVLGILPFAVRGRTFVFGDWADVL